MVLNTGPLDWESCALTKVVRFVRHTACYKDPGNEMTCFSEKMLVFIRKKIFCNKADIAEKEEIADHKNTMNPVLWKAMF